VDHWRANRRAVTCIGFIDKSQKSPALLLTAAGGVEAIFWTLDGIKLGTIGEGTPILWDTRDKSTWEGHQEKADDVDQEEADEDTEAQGILDFLNPVQEDRRQVVQDAVNTIFFEKKARKNHFPIQRTMHALKIHSEMQMPLDIEYREGTGPSMLLQTEIGKAPGRRRK